jgi:hypothetical protein
MLIDPWRCRRHRAVPGAPPGVRQACLDLEETLARPPDQDLENWTAETTARFRQLIEAFRHHAEQSEGPDGDPFLARVDVWSCGEWVLERSPADRFPEGCSRIVLNPVL